MENLYNIQWNPMLQCTFSIKTVIGYQDGLIRKLSQNFLEAPIISEINHGIMIKYGFVFQYQVQYNCSCSLEVHSLFMFVLCK